MMPLICALLQILLKEWSTRASCWTEITAVPFCTLETTRTLVLVTLHGAAPKVSALYGGSFGVTVIILSPFQYWSSQLISHHSLGITFSFFWKNQELESRFAVASGGKVISNGFSVYTNPFGGYVEFYTRGNNHRWKANIRVPGTFFFYTLFF